MAVREPTLLFVTERGFSDSDQITDVAFSLISGCCYAQYKMISFAQLEQLLMAVFTLVGKPLP